MKKLVLFAIGVLMVSRMVAQDSIIFTDGSEIAAKVTEVSDTEVKYKTFRNPTGPTWVKKTSDIFMIRYENGTNQTFTTEKNSKDSRPSKKNTPRYQETSPYQPVIPQLKNRSINGQACIALEVKEGPNYFYINPNDRYLRSTKGIRWMPSFSGFIEYYPKSVNNRNNPFAGIGLGVQYSFRGGLITKDFIPTPFDEDLRYICIRPAFCIRDDVAFMRFIPEFSIVTKATEEGGGYYNEDAKSETNSPILGFAWDWGFYLGKYITLGTYVEWSGIALNGDNSGLMNDEAFTESAYTHNLSFGVSLGVVINPLKIEENR